VETLGVPAIGRRLFSLAELADTVGADRRLAPVISRPASISGGRRAQLA
jgi:hypothetical protein